MAKLDIYCEGRHIDSFFELPNDISEDEIWDIIEENVGQWINYDLVEEDDEEEY